ncbi:hypothetical protein FS749_000527 [Ceratobasidium sp. UAMH 11750]|nr:hypothetical protein FS749_000527 [Ceratobasidium sp. UAMH 11750]
MTFDGQGTPEIYLQEDLLTLSSLLLQLTSSSSPPRSPRSTAIGELNRFSPLLRQAVVGLITPGVGKLIICGRSLVLRLLEPR